MPQKLGSLDLTDLVDVSAEKSMLIDGFELRELKVLVASNRMFLANDGFETFVVKEVPLVDEENQFMAEEALVANGIHNENLQVWSKQVEKDGNMYLFYRPGLTDLEMYYTAIEKDISVKDALSMILRVNNGIADLHKLGFIHADVAPANFLLTSDTVKLIDLDSAHSVDEKGLAKKGTVEGRRHVKGNRFINPPEYYETDSTGHVHFDKTIDIYESAVCLYRIIEGHWPYLVQEMEGTSVDLDIRTDAYADLHRARELNFSSKTPIRLQNSIRKAMRSDPKRRYGSIEEFSLELLKVYVRYDETSSDSH